MHDALANRVEETCVAKVAQAGVWKQPFLSYADRHQVLSRAVTQTVEARIRPALLEQTPAAAHVCAVRQIAGMRSTGGEQFSIVVLGLDLLPGLLDVVLLIHADVATKLRQCCRYHVLQ